MTKEQIFDVFKELIYENSYEVSRDVEINMESRVVEDLNINSLDRIDIIIAAEKAFDIELDEDAVADYTKIEDFVNLIEKNAMLRNEKREAISFPFLFEYLKL